VENRQTLLAAGGKEKGVIMEDFFKIADNVIHIDIKATPGASKTEITGIKEKRLCVRVAAAPEDGKANASLCAFLAKTLGCAKRDVVLIKGEKSRLKTIAAPAACVEKLNALWNN
jgi:uncharacterized protein (TIGR00251 family)